MVINIRTKPADGAPWSGWGSDMDAAVREAQVTISSYDPQNGGSQPQDGAKILSEYMDAADGNNADNALALAIADAGVAGAVVRTPRVGGYGQLVPWSPLERQYHYTTSSGSKYDWDDTEDTAVGSTPSTATYALAGFTGSAPVHMTNPNVGRGAMFERMMFAGLGDNGSSTLNGIDFGPPSGGERAWKFRGCQWQGFGGAAIAGHMWVSDISDFHIVRCGYGIRPASGAGGASCVAFDSRWGGNSMIYYTRNHGISFDSSAQCGQIVLNDMRIERCGTTVSGNTTIPYTNRNTDAYAIYATNLHALSSTSLTTDANAGGDIKLDSSWQHGKINNCIWKGAILKRSGTGDGDAATSTRGAVWAMDTNYVDIEAKITFGKPNDDSETHREAPQLGYQTAANYWMNLTGSVELPSGLNDIVRAYRTYIAGGDVNYQSYATDNRYLEGQKFRLTGTSTTSLT